jgi:hypothetical protein
MTAITPTQSNAQAVLGAFLASILPSDVAIVTAQQNRIAEPQVPTFVVMTPIRFMRLRTNIQTYADVQFVGTISGTVLTVQSIAMGQVQVGQFLFGSGVAANSVITALGPSLGQFLVKPSQSAVSQVIGAGAKIWEQGAELTIQLDFHSADTSLAGDLAQTVSTLFRSEYAVDQFATSGFDITPLYADDPRMVPFINENQQWEWRWVLEARTQCNDVVSLPQEFADSLDVGIISVDATYPP